MKTTYIFNREYKRLPSAKSILGDFCDVQFFFIVLLAAQVNRKIESDTEYGERHDQVTAVCYARNSEASVSNDGKIPDFRFC